MKIIGRKDHIDLLELGLMDIEAKIDTGAYGCSLHSHHIELVKKDGKTMLSFKVLDPEHPEYEGKTHYTSNYREKIVKSSSGEREHRYTIKTEIMIFNKKYRVEFSLTNRKEMKYPVLIGRKFLTKRFLVDVKQKDLSFKLKRSYENSSII